MEIIKTMEIFFTPSNLTSIFFVVTTALAALYIFNYLMTFKDRRYDIERKMIELEVMRRMFEERIYKDTERLTANSERWKDVNHLMLDAIRKTETVDDEYLKIYPSKFLLASGINQDDMRIDNRKVFVLTPFHPKYEKTFNIIRNACVDIGLKCSRGDEQFVAGGLLTHVLRELVTARIIIANIDGRNPNVFYEVGIAHALGKKVILVTSGLDSVPFDLRSQQLIIWNNIDELDKQLHQALAKLMID